jgi:hypothetical protein
MTPKSTSRQQKQEHLLRTQLYVFEQALMHQIEPSLSRYKADCLYLTLYGLKRRLTEPPPDLSHSKKVGLGKQGFSGRSGRLISKKTLRRASVDLLS